MTVAGITDIVDVCPHCASQCSDNPEYAVLRRTLKWRWCGPCGSLVEFVRLPERMRAVRQDRFAAARADADDADPVSSLARSSKARVRCPARPQGGGFLPP